MQAAPPNNAGGRARAVWEDLRTTRKLPLPAPPPYRPPRPPLRPAQYAHIVGWGMAVPENRMTNDDLAAFIDTDDEWIVSRTGIRERRIATDRDTTSTLAFRAAQAALDEADVLPEDLDLIIVATSTAENTFPSTANQVQAALNATRAGAFDLSAACAGFIYGVNMAAQAIRSGSIRHALVIGSETMSRIVDWSDRSTCILFGDGAGAVVLQASDIEGGVLSAVLRSDGSGADLLHAPGVGSLDTPNAPTSENGRRLMKLSMNGGEVFKFATRVINESLLQAVQGAGLTLGDLRLIVPHQANTRILQSAARSLRIDESLFFTNIERYGNTSAASIPIALCEAVQQGRVQASDHIALVGFGGGLTWGSLVVRWGVPSDLERGRFNYQRRRISYVLAAWRVRLSRLGRRVTGVLSALRPRRRTKR
jgi:3-oxoacyl-[acyl-carrier-protein] synthase-3